MRLRLMDFADQGKVSEILGQLFGIKTGFHGKLVSNMARVSPHLVTSSFGRVGCNTPPMQSKRVYSML